VIHLAPRFTAKARHPGSSKPKFKNLEVQSDVDLSTVGFQPVHQYISELEKLYGTSIVFFHSATSGSSIAGLWNPQAVSPRPFKVNLTYASKPTAESEEEVELDKASILAEIARLGGDMVSRVEVHR
jgi:U3 small nucleolar RNA-associated protein 22